MCYQILSIPCFLALPLCYTRCFHALRFASFQSSSPISLSLSSRFHLDHHLATTHILCAVLSVTQKDIRYCSTRTISSHHKEKYPPPSPRRSSSLSLSLLSFVLLQLISCPKIGSSAASFSSLTEPLFSNLYTKIALSARSMCIHTRVSIHIEQDLFS